MAANKSNALSGINYIVVVMLENRSLDHMLGFLYTDANNVSPSGQPYEGLQGNESNPGTDGKPVSVYKITPDTTSTYFLPGSDPGEGYTATNAQLFGSNTAPTLPTATNQGFITDFSYTLGWESKENYSILKGTVANDIMAIHTEE